jgi:hypothetical protein
MAETPDKDDEQFFWQPLIAFVGAVVAIRYFRFSITASLRSIFAAPAARAALL